MAFSSFDSIKNRIKNFPALFAFVKALVKGAWFLLCFAKSLFHNKNFFGKNPASIFVTHALGGGTEVFTKNFLQEHSGQNIFLVTPVKFFYDDFIFVQNAKTKKTAIFKNIFQVLRNAKIERIFCNSIVSFKKWEATLRALTDFKTQNDARLEYFLHDFHCVCPNYNLMASSAFCALECEKYACDFSKNDFTKISGIKKWRALWADFLGACDCVWAFSASSKDIFLKAYPAQKNKVIVKPHKMSHCNFFCAKPFLPRIAIVGSVTNEAKGLFVAKDFLNFAKTKDAQIFVIGDFPFSEKKEFSLEKNIHFLGHYKQSDLQSIFLANAINAVFFPSVCPETFSYLVSEIILMDIPLVCFSLGAQGEKCAAYKKGRALALGTCAEKIYLALEAAFKNELLCEKEKSAAQNKIEGGG